MFLLKEQQITNKVKLLEEKDTNGNKQQYIQGVFMQAEVLNGNNRIYPYEILKNATEKYINEKVNTNRGWGELGHPDSPEINADRISHRIVSLVEKGNDWIGKAILITENACGATVRGLINSGGEIGVSSRALGSVINKNGIDYVQDDLYICTASDIVLDPSAPDAFVQSLFENKQWVWDNGFLIEKDLTQMKKNINKSVRTNNQQVIKEQKINALKLFISKL